MAFRFQSSPSYSDFRPDRKRLPRTEYPLPVYRVTTYLQHTDTVYETFRAVSAMGEHSLSLLLSSSAYCFLLVSTRHSPRTALYCTVSRYFAMDIPFLLQAPPRFLASKCTIFTMSRKCTDMDIITVCGMLR